MRCFHCVHDWMLRRVGLLAVLLVAGWIGCSTPDAEQPVTNGNRETADVSLAASEDRSAKTEATSDEAGHETPHWSYHGDTGPEHWGDLDPAYIAAKYGKAQSPIDIHTDAVHPAKLPPVQMTYHEVEDVQVWNNGHSIEVDVSTDTDMLTIGEKTYKLAQFHFHEPSEHLVDGKEFPAEMHLVHQAADGSLAVLAVFIKRGHKNEELGRFWNHLPEASEDEGAEPKKETVKSFHLQTLLPKERNYYRYIGSLTTPPCTEGVNWTVFAEPIEMSEEQISEAVRLFSGPNFPHGDRRPCQPLNGRVVQTTAR